MQEDKEGSYYSVYKSNLPEDIQLISLVLSAAGIGHKAHPLKQGSWSISVNQCARNDAQKEISAFLEENNNWPATFPSKPEFSPILRVLSLITIGSLIIIYSLTGDWAVDSPWFSSGCIDSSAILYHAEYYRLLTALTLHADIVHLLSNCFLGVILLHYFFLITGNGIGLFMLLVTSISANMINVYAHGPGHLAVGFSTAIFAIIGMLSALNYRKYKFSHPAKLFFPIMAGASLLAMLGSSGVRTDLGAHFFGLFTGLIGGTFLGIEHIFRLRHSIILQLILVIPSLVLPFIAWKIALG